MKRTEDILITELINRCNLGEVTSKIETVSGGFMHRMYKVCTDKGTYAVKHLKKSSGNSRLFKCRDESVPFVYAININCKSCKKLPKSA